MIQEKLETINKTIEPLRERIINHPLYSEIENLEDLKIFMEYHVFAVWDFMSLLKALQNKLTCVSIPWYPVGDGETRFLINEIVAGEESDIDHEGNRKSHFELYLEAMEQCGANTTMITSFLSELKTTNNFESAFLKANVPSSICEFIRSTFNVIETNQAHIQSAVFTFGREDLIPEMFISIVKDIEKTFPDSVAIYKYYLERHIEVDGDHHSHLALQMTSTLCGESKENWEQAQKAIIEALQMRIHLWDGALAQIQINKKQKKQV